jgi:aspartate/methionine/tyrosine aminotransferase
MINIQKYSDRAMFPTGYDFCDILPTFIEYKAPEFKPINIKYDFGIGDIRNVPGLDEYVDKAVSHLENKVSGLTMILPGMQGFQPLCEILADLIKNETKQQTFKENIVITDGGCDGLSLSVMAICNPGDGIAYAVPSFPYWSVFYATGVEQYPVLCWPPETYAEKFGTLLGETIEKHPNIKAVLLNEPENPLGFKVNESQLKQISELVEEKNLFVILDDVARPFISDTEEWWGKFFNPEKCFIVDSFTKRFALPGLRLGFVRAEKEGALALRSLVANMRGGVGNVHSFFGLKLVQELIKANKLNIVKEEVYRRMTALIKVIKSNTIEGIDFFIENRGIYGLFEVKNSFIKEKRKPVDLQRHLLGKGLKCLIGNFMFPNLAPNDSKKWIFRLSIGAERDVEDGAKYLFALLSDIV